jgi:hypothetical protein
LVQNFCRLSRLSQQEDYGEIAGLVELASRIRDHIGGLW